MADRYWLCVTCGVLKSDDLFQDMAVTCDDCHEEGRDELNFVKARDGQGYVRRTGDDR